MTQLSMFSVASPKPPQDITAHRHGGQRNSVKAHERIVEGEAHMIERVHKFIAGCGFHGATSADIEKAFGIAKNKFSGRITTLKKEGRVFDSGRDRDSCSVLVADKRHCNGSSK